MRAIRSLFCRPNCHARANDPREVVNVSFGSYHNHVSRMDYPSYRRQGIPFNSSPMESTVKQVSRRVKGSEKYWSTASSEIMLWLRGEYLSDNIRCNLTGNTAPKPPPAPAPKNQNTQLNTQNHQTGKSASKRS